ncbi:MAG: alpha/beta fold hydrolase [Acidimicrobiia bacterium]
METETPATGILLAHGAGTNKDHPLIARIREGLEAAGYTVHAFNYPYVERGSKRPDHVNKLLEAHRDAADELAPKVDRLFLAGRSMGGRIGTRLAAEGYPCDGVILYAYPLHPPGKPEKLRIEHLPRIQVPMLFFQGTRDALARMDLFEEHIASLRNADVEILEGAGHGLKGGGWALESLSDRYVDGTIAWISRLSSGGTEARAR